MSFFELRFHGFVDRLGDGQEAFPQGLKLSFFFAGTSFDLVGKKLEEGIIQTAASHRGDGGQADIGVGAPDQEVEQVFTCKTGFAQFLELIYRFLGLSSFQRGLFSECGMLNQRFLQSIKGSQTLAVTSSG